MAVVVHVEKKSLHTPFWKDNKLGAREWGNETRGEKRKEKKKPEREKKGKFRAFEEVWTTHYNQKFSRPWILHTHTQFFFVFGTSETTHNP